MDFIQGQSPRKGRRLIIESKIPVHLLDILDLASLTLGSKSKKYPILLLKFYIRRLAQEEFSQIDLAKQLSNGLIKGKPLRELKLKGLALVNDVAVIKAKTRINDTSDIIRLAVLRIYEEVLRTKNTETLSQLKAQLSLQ